MFDATVALLGFDPSDWEPARLTTVARELAQVRAALDAADARVLAAMARTKAHARDGASDAAGWLRNETGVSRREAQRRTKLASDLEASPVTAGSLAKGFVTAEHAAVLAAAIARTPALRDREEQLLALAVDVAVEEFARHVRRVEMLVTPDDGASLFERQRRQRHVTVSPTRSGGYRLSGFLDDVAGREVEHALHLMAEKIWRDTGDEHDAGQRRADALVHLCRQGSRDLSKASVVHQAVPTVLVVTDIETLRSGLHEHGICETDHGTPLSAETVRRLACQADLLPVVLGKQGEILDLGRSGRLASVAQRRALIFRSQGSCEVPGCAAPWWCCDAHHTGPGGWDGLAPTNLDLLAWVCGRHHHDLHEGGATLTRQPDGSFTYLARDGTALTEPARRRPHPRRRPTRTRPSTEGTTTDDHARPDTARPDPDRTDTARPDHGDTGPSGSGDTLTSGTLFDLAG